MAEPARRTRDLREELEDSVIEPLFAKAPKVKPDGSVPEVVFHHRSRRARERLLDALVSRGSSTVPPELWKQVEALLRRWSAASFADAFEEVEAFEVRCALDYDRVVAEESGDREKLLEVLEQEYRRCVVEQFGRIELRGLQTSHRIMQDLEEVFVPLYLEGPPVDFQDESGYILRASGREKVSEILDRNRHVLIIGAPGSGKSTLVAHLAIQLAAERKAPLPLVLTVRALKAPTLSAASIADHTGCHSDLLNQALERQHAVLLVDGLDEAPEDSRTRLLNALQRLIRLHPGIRLIATSRPAGPPGEIEKAVPGLEPYRLADLSREEADTFIDKWCLAAEISLRSDRAQAEKEAEKAASDLKRRLGQSRSVQRIAVNPLLVTILCVVHRFLGRTIPEHRVTLYEKCTDALLYEWDRAKFADGAAVGLLDAKAKARLLMGLARRVHEDHAAELAEKEVVQHFVEVLPDLGRPASDAKKIIADIRDRSGLLVERRPSFFAFSHLTFQEYFCALDYVRTKSFAELVEHYQEGWWSEVIVLTAGAPGGGQGQVPRRLLAKNDRAAVFLAAKCLETESDMPLGVRERVERELSRFVPPRAPNDLAGLLQVGVVAAPLLAKALLSNELTERVLTLLAFEPLDYDPAVPIIAGCVGDHRSSGFSFQTTGGYWVPTVAAVAAHVLTHRAKTSATASAALRNVLPRLSEGDLKGLHDFHVFLHTDPQTIELFEDALKARRREKPRPKRA